MQPVRVGALHLERIQYEEEQKRLVEIDVEIQDLAEKAKVLRETKTLFRKEPALISCLIDNLKSSYPDLPPTLSPQALEVAIQRVEADQNHLLQERAFIMSPLTDLPEELLNRITDAASAEAKTTLSQVSRSWRTYAIASLQHEYDRFIQHKIGQYIEALTPNKVQPPFHSSPDTLAAVRADLAHIMDDHCSIGVLSLIHLRDKVFELRNRARVALSRLDPADFPRIPSTPAPFGVNEVDRSKLLSDLPYYSFHCMQNLLVCYGPVGEVNANMLGILCQQGDVVTAREIARNIGSGYFFIYSFFIDTACLALVQAGEIDGALEIIGKVDQNYRRDFVLVQIALGIARRGDIARARTFVDLLSRENDKTNLLTGIAVILTKKGDVEGALELARSSLVSHEKNWALHRICIALAQAGSIEQALQILIEIKGESPRSSVIENIVEAALKIKDFDRALACASLLPNGATDLGVNLFAPIANQVARSGNIDRALEIISLIPFAERQSELLFLISVIGTLGQVERALGLVASLDFRLREEALKRLGIALADNGDIEKASYVATLIPDSYSEKVTVMCQIAEAVAKTGDIDQAFNMLKTHFREVHTLDELTIDTAFGHIAQMAVKAQDVDRALRILDLKPLKQVHLLYTIVDMLAKSGDTEHAQVIANMIKNRKFERQEALQCIGYWEEKLALHNSKG